MPSEVPFLVNLSFYALLIWGLSAVLAALRHLVEDERRGLSVRIGLFSWIGVPAVLGMSGRLADFEAAPLLLPLMFVMFAVVVLFALSPWGGYAAARLPESLLIGFQAFRFPLELVLYALAMRNLLPAEMTFVGYNFDIITGVAALLLWRAVRRGAAPRWLLWVWNSLGLLLLAVIGSVAVLSLPEPFGWFHPENRLIAFYPWVLAPTFLIQVALLGHLLLFRKLLQPQPEPFANI